MAHVDSNVDDVKAKHTKLLFFCQEKKTEDSWFVKVKREV